MFIKKVAEVIGKVDPGSIYEISKRHAPFIVVVIFDWFIVNEHVMLTNQVFFWEYGRFCRRRPFPRLIWEKEVKRG